MAGARTNHGIKGEPTASAVTPRGRTAAVPLPHRHALCNLWGVAICMALRRPCAKTSAAGSVLVRRHSHTGACDSRHAGYIEGLAQWRNINAPGGLSTSVTPRRGHISGTLPSLAGRPVPMARVLGDCAPIYVDAVVASIRRSSF